MTCDLNIFPRSNLVSCSIDADRCGPLKGKVEQGAYRIVTLEGEVQSSIDGVVMMGNGQVIGTAD